MGRQTVGDFIRKIDYLKAKPGNDYKDSADNPSNQLIDVGNKTKDISLDELKDAFKAFEEKVCIQSFPENGSPAYWVAYSTVNLLLSLGRSFKSDHEDMKTRVAELQFQTLVALARAGPGSTHCELIGKLIDSDVKEYAKTIGAKQLASVMAAVKVTFRYPPNDYCEEYNYGSMQHNYLKQFFLLFSTEQYGQVQKEFLDIYLHYNVQIPALSEKYAQQMYYTVRDILDNFEERNPYLHLKDVEMIKKHLCAVKDMARSKSFVKGKGGTADAADKMLSNIFKAILKDGVVIDVFDHMASLILEINEKGVDDGKKKVFDMCRGQLFRNLKNNKIPVLKLFRSCVTLSNTLLSQDNMTPDLVLMLEGIVDEVIKKSKPIASDDVKDALLMVNQMVNSGWKILISSGADALEHMKTTKALDWKKHIEAAKQILDTLGMVTKEKMQDDSKTRLDDTARAYRNFLKKFLDQLKKSKVLPQLQDDLVKLAFNCLTISPPVKTEMAYECSGRDFMDFSKQEKLRLDVLKRSEAVLKNKDLPLDDRDLGTTISNVLRIVVDSYDRNGKAVTDEENQYFISIFKMISEDGESVEEHFYEEEHEDIPNINMKIWRQVVMEYISLHQATSTLSCLTPFMPEVLRWTKISMQDDHDDMMHLCFSILSSIGQRPPIDLKDCLPEFVDLMLESDRCDEMFSLVNALYPHNPAAVHDRLQDMFDDLDTLKDNQHHVVISLFGTIAQKHPEVFTKQQISAIFEMYKAASEATKPLYLMLIRTIAEKHPKNLADFLPQLCDPSIFSPASLNLRSGIISCIGGINEQFGQKAADYLMKYIDHSDPTISHIVAGTVFSMLRKHQDYMQKYKSKIEKLENTSTIPQVRDLAHDMILVLEGKSVENIVEDIQQQQEDIAGLDTKVDATIDTVINIGDKVIEHDKEIGELEVGLERVEERVDDVEEDLGETKIKVEEVDNKTMSNAPKWSRDLTKIMNPASECDWRLLASRLGYSNDDIRGWATQHDPCMALLSEWYATHKTSEASFGVLNALTEMNRMDGAAIVENAMKAAEGVVEDEEFEYPSPPPVFLSYQWGYQNEVKLLKQHLNMAGYECWMDVGQMGGGDKLFSKIDNGIRGAKIVICCVTEKYAKSPNCNREVNLSVNLNKPIIPLLMEKMAWPPPGSMGPIFSEYLFIRFFQRDGEETKESDQRYWPIPKFQELLMQLNFFVVPDQKMVKREYANWWAPMVEDIVVDKNKGKKKTSSQKPTTNETQVAKTDESPLVFLSYQWGKQPQIQALYKRLTSLGYTVWMDIYQMGGGDSLYDKIDRGMRGCKAVVSCVTQKYSLSANCRREVSLADALKKPIIPLLLEQMKWPPDGPMSMMFTELLYINCYRDEALQTTWKGEKFDELILKLCQFVPEITESNESSGESKSTRDSKTKGPGAPADKGTMEKKKTATKDGSGEDNKSKTKENEKSKSVVNEEKDNGTGRKTQSKTLSGNKTVVAKAAAVNALAKGKQVKGNSTQIKLKEPLPATKTAEQEKHTDNVRKEKTYGNNDRGKSQSLSDSKMKSKVSAVNSLANKTSIGKSQSAANSQKTASDNPKLNAKGQEKAKQSINKSSTTQLANGSTEMTEKRKDKSQSNETTNQSKSKSCTLL